MEGLVLAAIIATSDQKPNSVEIEQTLLTELRPTPTITHISLQEDIQHKIDTNFYKCNDQQYIRKDNAECIDKPIVKPTETPPKRVSTPKAVQIPVRARTTSTAPASWYPKYQCTWHVWTKRPVGNWNNASEWVWQAKRDGYETGNTPRVGAIAQRGNHVAYVERVKADLIYISERNWDNRGSYRETWKPARNYRYIY